MKRIFGNHLSRKEQKRIVIAGTAPGVGVTHFSLTLANVAAARQRRSTLYVEVGDRGNIAALRTKNTFAIDGNIGFRLNEVGFLPHVDAAAACGIFSDPKWDVIICDVTERMQPDILAASTRCLLLVDVKPWHYSVFQQTMKEWMWERNKKRASLLSLHLRSQDEKRCRKEFGMRIEELPFVADPFRMTHAEAAAAAVFL